MLLAFLAVTVAACERPERHGDAPAPIRVASVPNPQRDVYFVETHVHTDWSVERSSPDTAAAGDEAYRSDKREAGGGVVGHDVQRKSESFDFIARMERHVLDTCAQGLLVQAREGSNPHKFGVVGGSDNPYWGANGFDDHATTASEAGGPDDRLTPSRRSVVSAEALGGVWAEEDTRESIVEAMNRRETFATSGTRIQLRFFGGWSYADDLVDQDRWVARAYERGVPMGGDLSAPPADRAPKFVVWAVRDADSAPLERLQIVKGWVEGGAEQEEVYDVACSDGGEPEATTGRCPNNGASVDLSDCSFSTDKGDAELGTVWTDPAFDPSRHAFYAVRVLENPTCRRSTRDAMRRGVAPPADAPRTVRERALSSPIWYTPAEASR